MAIAKTPNPIAKRLAKIGWTRIERELEADGWSRIPELLTAGECAAVVRDYDRDQRYRSTIDMQRYRFGQGRYRYFAYPLPPLVETLRHHLYTRLHSLANLWAARLGREILYPETLSAFLARCEEAGQVRPTPLVLRYEAGDYNRLHQDLYGAVAFPLQVLINLSERGRDYDGGEVIFLEQRPRAQSKATAVTAARGEGVIFTNSERPVRGSRGFYRVSMRHGASRVTRGHRFVLGIIFHDAL